MNIKLFISHEDLNTYCHDEGMVSNLVLGSVATKVIHPAKVPVLLVK